MTQPRHSGSAGPQWPLALVLAGAGVGVLLLVLGVGGFRPGATVIGVSVVGAALLRAALPERTAGLLAVRSRPTDVVLLAGLGLAIVALASLVPASP